MQIPLQIVLHGLIALVPPDAGHPNQLTALLLDGQHPPAHECIAPHEPMLEFNATTSAACLNAGCTVSGDLCTCGAKALEGRDLSLKLSGASRSAQSKLNVRPENPLPLDDQAAIDFAYVPNMSAKPYGVKLNPAYQSAHPPSNLLARMEVPFNSIAACALWQHEDEGQNYTFALNARKLKEAEGTSSISQAVAQMVVATLDLTPQGSKVEIHLRSFATGEEKVIGVKLSSKGSRIALTNDTVPLDRDDPCDDGIARHFALYYELADKEVAFGDRLVPHMKFTHHQKSPAAPPDGCKLNDFDVMNRPVCPMATIQPELPQG